MRTDGLRYGRGRHVDAGHPRAGVIPGRRKGKVVEVELRHSPSPRVSPPAKRRLWARVLAGVVLAPALLAGSAYLWAKPRHEYPLPDRHATPIQVVSTYLDALNARDFDTSNAIPSPVEHNGLWSTPGRWTSVRDLRLVDPERHDAHVLFTFVPRGVGGFASGDREIFGFYLDRIDGRWRITGSGVV